MLFAAGRGAGPGSLTAAGAAGGGVFFFEAAGSVHLLSLAAGPVAGLMEPLTFDTGAGCLVATLTSLSGSASVTSVGFTLDISEGFSAWPISTCLRAAKPESKHRVKLAQKICAECIQETQFGNSKCQIKRSPL